MTTHLRTTRPPAAPTAPHRAGPATGTGAGYRLRLTLRLVAIAAAATVLAACGASADEPTDDDRAARTTEAAEVADLDVEATAGADSGRGASPVTDDEPDAPNVAPGGLEDGPARVVRLADHLDALDVHDAPTAGSVSHTLGAATEFGSARVLLVVAESDDRLEVLLPVRPNGTTGWVDRSDVEVAEVELHVNIDLDARELTVLEAGEEVLTTTVAIGDADHPTPTGTFSITDKLATGEPDGAYGPYAIGLSGRSDVLTEFAGGDGQIGIHGTNDPSSIGQAASHGCVRVDNAVIEQLVALLPLGTPVTVT